MTILRLVFVLRTVAAGSAAAFLDRRVPGHLKLLAAAATLFVLSPLNLLGDIPLLGIVDDAGLLLLVFGWFTRASAPYRNTLDL